MRSFLEGLEINQKVQSFFKKHLVQTCEDAVFKQYNYFEHVSHDFHRIPLTEATWQAGNPELASDIVICGSAMDAIAWLHFNQHKFKTLDSIFFIATGAIPTNIFAAPLQKHTSKKIHLLYSNDPLGAICDIKTASFIRNTPVKILAEKEKFIVTFRAKTFVLEQLSLHVLEKAARFHFNIRTHKPKKHNTFYEQLKHRHPS
ncbi:MAG: hypothetical protein M3O71_21225 [Bacteroidota bacterium]|nr:hypothetical protein [Bacteroidota bacterium]